jgi:hypothetical protein
VVFFFVFIFYYVAFFKAKYERFVKLSIDLKSPHSNARGGHKQDIYFTGDDAA